MATPYNPLDSNSGRKPPWRSMRGPARASVPQLEPQPGEQQENAKAPLSYEPRGDRSPIETDFAELKDGTIVELVEDPANPGRKCFAVWNGGEIRFLNRVEQDGQVFIPPSRDSTLLESIRLPRGAESYKSARELLTGVESLISQCVSVDEKYVPVLANFVLSTWFVDRLSVAPYLSVVGLPHSGKTTLLKLLSLVCRRSLLLADISSSSLYRACARFMPTILIDEAGTVGNSRALRHLLRSGTTREVLALRTDASLHSYGPKVFSWMEPPDDPALNSRCILVPMFENKSTMLAPKEDRGIRSLAVDLQAQLLRFRLEKFKTVQSVAVSGDEVLRPRTRDLLRSLTAATVEDSPRSQRLLEFFESGQALPSEPLSPEQNAVLHLLFSIVHSGESYSSVWVSELTKQLNLYLEHRGGAFALAAAKSRCRPHLNGFLWQDAHELRLDPKLEHT
jgi:hypothetical protein